MSSHKNSGGGGGNPSVALNGYVSLIQGLIQFLESSTGYATILGLHPQIGKLEWPFNDNNNSTLFRYFQWFTRHYLNIILGLDVKRKRLIIKDHKCISFCSKRRFMSNFHQLKIKAEISLHTKGSILLKRDTFLRIDWNLWEKDFL